MNVLIEIGHPAHVHFFCRVYFRLREQGHRVWVVTRAKEMTNELLTQMKIPFDCLSSPATGKAGMLLELLGRWRKIRALIQREKIDVAVSISGISTSFPARVCGIRNILFTDTEDATLSNRIAFPFADAVVTPEFFLRHVGIKHHRYRGLHELSYLQHFNEIQAKQVRKALALPDRYCLVRLVGNEALHDSDLQGFGTKALEDLVARLSAFGDVFISSPSPLPRMLDSHRLKFPVDKIHSVMEGSLIFVGESPTMAVESGLLGVPAYLVSGRVDRLGNMIGLKREGLLNCYRDWQALQENLPSSMALISELRDRAKARARAFTATCCDMDKMMLSEIIGGAVECAA